MWGWLGRVLGWGISNLAPDIASWVHDILHGVWGWLSAIFGHVGDGWHVFWTGANWVWRTAQHFGSEIHDCLYVFFHIVIPNVVRWASTQLKRLEDYANRIYNFARQWVQNLIKRIEQAVINLSQWVTTHVWLPLKRDFLQAWNWISHNGDILWHYLTHPDQLAALLFDSLLTLLEKEAWTAGRRLGKFFLALFLHNLNQVLALVEDIVTAVL